MVLGFISFFETPPHVTRALSNGRCPVIVKVRDFNVFCKIILLFYHGYFFAVIF